MTYWTANELARLDGGDEMHIAGRRADGSHAKAVIVWMVRLGDEVYTRSVNGPDAAWFRATRPLREGHINAAGVDRDVAFIDIDPEDPVNDALDAAYRSKYRRYPGPVDSITSRLARAASLKLVPRQK